MAHGPSGYSGGFTAKQRRTAIARADGLCQLCHVAPATVVDHITPRSRGGADRLDNAQALCRPCHSRKTTGEGLSGWAAYNERRRTRRDPPPHPGLVQ